MSALPAKSTGRPTLSNASLTRARAAKRKAQTQLADEALNGVGLSRRANGYVITVLLAEPLMRPAECPSEIDGFPLELQVTGRISAQREPPAPGKGASKKAIAAAGSEHALKSTSKNASRKR